MKKGKKWKQSSNRAAVFTMAAALSLAAASGLSACGAGGSKSMAVAEATAAAMAPPAAGFAGRTEAGYIMPETAAAMDYAVNEAAAEEAYDTAASTGNGSSFESGIEQARTAGRKLIRTVNLTMETEKGDFDRVVAAVNAKIAEMGGYTERSELAGGNLGYQGVTVPRWASISARIPSDKLDRFLATVESSGNVTHRTESTEDVTLQYSDMESRKKSLEIEQERIWALLEKADTLEAVISLEERLSEIRYELETMESQLRIYDNQVEYSTVNLTIDEVELYTQAAPETPMEKIQRGFADNLTALGDTITNFIIGLITTSPFWVPAAVVVWIVWIFVHRRAKAKRDENKETTAKTTGLKWFRKKKDSKQSENESKI